MTQGEGASSPASTSAGGTVFVGGTGRSGTTVLSRLLSTHPSIQALAQELRLLTDPHGLIALEDALVHNWSPFRAATAVGEFRQLVKDLATPLRGRYPGAQLAKVFGRDALAEAVRTFVRGLGGFESTILWGGNATPARKIGQRLTGLSMGRREYLVGPLSAEDYRGLAGHLLRKLFELQTECTEATVAVDHTPYSFLYADKIRSYLPDAQFIHVYRDPRDVIASYTGMDWAPSDPEESARIVAWLLGAWEGVRGGLTDDCYLEVCLEDLVARQVRVVEDICRFLRIPPSPGLAAYPLDR